jgi:hypothetical protein
MRTLEKLRAAQTVEIQQRVKVTRREVRSILLRSVWSYPFPKIWQKQLDSTGKAVAPREKLA